jgi:anti-sigma regulatory factor (Ser/Thr protein kinase)
LNTKRTFSAELSQLHPIIEWIRCELVSLRLDKTVLGKIELALEEAVVNVVHHAYKHQKGTLEIQLVHQKGERSIHITVCDRGPPFNPLEHATTFDPLASLEERDIGGLGIFLMKQYMDDIRYMRQGETNLLTLTKQIA